MSSGLTSPVAPWCTGADLPESSNSEAVKPATLTTAFAYASTILFNLTKRRWPGTREDTYRPCCECDTDDCCSCYPARSIELIGYPVIAITSLTIDGAVVPANDYELRDESRLCPVRHADGTLLLIRRWQDMTLPVTEVGTYQIAYTWGAAPPPEGATMAAILGYEVALSWTPSTLGACRLPKRVTSITRQGITMALIDPLTLFKDGMVGIPEVDLWISAVNIGDSHNGAELWDPMAMRRGTRKTI